MNNGPLSRATIVDGGVLIPTSSIVQSAAIMEVLEVLAAGPDRRKVICLWCHDEIYYQRGEAGAMEAVWRQMLAHDVICPENPSVQRIATLTAALKEAVEEVGRFGHGSLAKQLRKVIGVEQ